MPFYSVHTVSMTSALPLQFVALQSSARRLLCLSATCLLAAVQQASSAGGSIRSVLSNAIQQARFWNPAGMQTICAALLTHLPDCNLTPT